MWTFPAVASVVWSVLAVSVGAMALYYYLLTNGTVGRVAAHFYLIPGTVALLGWALFGERLTPVAVVGFAVASGGVFLVARRPPAHRRWSLWRVSVASYPRTRPRFPWEAH